MLRFFNYHKYSFSLSTFIPSLSVKVSRSRTRNMLRARPVADMHTRLTSGLVLNFTSKVRTGSTCLDKILQERKRVRGQRGKFIEKRKT